MLRAFYKTYTNLWPSRIILTKLQGIYIWLSLFSNGIDFIVAQSLPILQTHSVSVMVFPWWGYRDFCKILLRYGLILKSQCCKNRGYGNLKEILVKIWRLQGLASLGESGVLALVRPQQRKVHISCPRCCWPQWGVVTSPAEGHGGSSSVVSIAKNKLKLYMDFDCRNTTDETDQLNQWGN